MRWRFGNEFNVNSMMPAISTTAAISLSGLLVIVPLPSVSQLGTGAFASKNGSHFGEDQKQIWLDVGKINATSTLIGLPTATQTASGPTPEENLTHIESILNPSVTELSVLLKVSRQAIYDWKKGGQIHTDNAEKLRDIALAAGAFAGRDAQFIHHILRRKIGGRNFFARIHEGEAANEVAKKLLDIAGIEQQQREMISAQLKDRPKRIDVIAVPGRHYQDENG